MQYIKNNMRPAKSAVYQQKKPVHPPENQEGFSPLLAALLSITMKDGLVNSTSFSLLRDIYPYVCQQDRKVIEHTLQYKNMASEISSLGSAQPCNPLHLRRSLTSRETMFGLLRVLRQYGGRQSDATFDQLERMIKVKDAINRYTKNPQDPMGLLDMMGMLGGDAGPIKGAMENFGQISSMMNMMRGAGGMGNMADIFRMMGMNNPSK